MAKLYYKRIKANLMTIEDVPALWLVQLQVLLDTEE